MQLDLTTIPAIGTATTVSLHKSGSKVLVGTSERELYELSALGEGALEPKDEEEEGPKEEVPVGELLNTIAIGPSGSGITAFSSASTTHAWQRTPAETNVASEKRRPFASTDARASALRAFALSSRASGAVTTAGSKGTTAMSTSTPNAATAPLTATSTSDIKIRCATL